MQGLNLLVRADACARSICLRLDQENSFSMVLRVFMRLQSTADLRKINCARGNQLNISNTKPLYIQGQDCLARQASRRDIDDHQRITATQGEGVPASPGMMVRAPGHNGAPRGASREACARHRA